MFGKVGNQRNNKMIWESLMNINKTWKQRLKVFDPWMAFWLFPLFIPVWKNALQKIEWEGDWGE